jgi:hypothetical protein
MSLAKGTSQSANMWRRRSSASLCAVLMRQTGNFHSEWIGSDRAPSFRDTLSNVLVATAIGAVAGSSVMVSLIDAPVTTDRSLNSARAFITNGPASSPSRIQSEPVVPSVMPTTPGVVAPDIRPSVSDVPSEYKSPKETRIGTHRSKRWWRFPHGRYPSDGSIRSER